MTLPPIGLTKTDTILDSVVSALLDLLLGFTYQWVGWVSRGLGGRLSGFAGRTEGGFAS